MLLEGNSALRKRMAGEFLEDNQSIRELVETLIESFLRTDSSYGEITDVKCDIDGFYKCVMDYVRDEKLDMYALKFDDRILLSRTGFGFEEIYKVVRMNSILQRKEKMLELWDDEKNKILHVIIAPLRKHFPIEYSDGREKLKIMKNLQL